MIELNVFQIIGIFAVTAVWVFVVFAIGYFCGVNTGIRRAVENPVDAVMKIDRENFQRELKDIKKVLKIK